MQGGKEGEGVGGIQLDEGFFKGLKDFLHLYSAEGNGLETKQLELQRRLALVDDKVKANAENFNKFRQDRDTDNEIKSVAHLCQHLKKIVLKRSRGLSVLFFLIYSDYSYENTATAVVKC